MQSKKFAKQLIIIFSIIIFLCGGIAIAASYSGNNSSYKFHRVGCRYYNCKNCTFTFSSRDEAIEAGYEPCKVCNP